jgi:hypothetical protein
MNRKCEYEDLRGGMDVFSLRSHYQSAMDDEERRPRKRMRPSSTNRDDNRSDSDQILHPPVTISAVATNIRPRPYPR